MIDANDSWNVSFVQWESFLEIMLNRENDPRWVTLWEDTDALIGGLNYEGDFLYVFVNSFPCTDNIPHERNPLSQYGVNSTTATQYHRSSKLLESRLMIWPPPRELLIAGEKLETHNLLNKCSQVLGYRHPMISCVAEEDLESYASQIGKGDKQGVLK